MDRHTVELPQPTLSEKVFNLKGQPINRLLRAQADYCVMEIAQTLFESRGKRLTAEMVECLSFLYEVQLQCEEQGY